MYAFFKCGENSSLTCVIIPLSSSHCSLPLRALLSLSMLTDTEFLTQCKVYLYRTPDIQPGATNNVIYIGNHLPISEH